MANIAPALVRVHPSYVMPELLVPYSQASGAFDTLPDGDPAVRLSEGDLLVYINRIEVRTKAPAVGQAAFNELPSCDVILSDISTPTYLARSRAEYDHHDTAAMGRYGVAIVEAQRLANRQAHFQFARVMLLNGVNPAYGEGLLNTNGATAVLLPADSNGNTTATTYDAGQMAFFLLSQISAIKTATMQLGIPRTFVFLGTQEIFGLFEYQDIVQLVEYQRIGAGSTSVAGLVKEVAGQNGDTVIWVYDDTLKGQGQGGSDAVIVCMPRVEMPEASNKINTNEFARLQPGLDWCTGMWCDMAAPREIPVPLAGGAIDVTFEWRLTSGLGIRPEAVRILSIPYP